MAAARLEDAKALLAAGRYDGAVYLVGYAIECKLKARIATRLFGTRRWPESPAEFAALSRLQTHKLSELLVLARREQKVTAK